MFVEQIIKDSREIAYSSFEVQKCLITCPVLLGGVEVPPLAGAALVTDHDVAGPQRVVAVLIRAIAVPARCLIVKPANKSLVIKVVTMLAGCNNQVLFY